jgi:hypothetical protein
MTVSITINVPGDSPAGAVGSGYPTAYGAITTPQTESGSGVSGAVSELRDQMGDQIGPFPDAGVDGFLSHFVMMIEFLQGEQNGRIATFTMPAAVQTVARSRPFIYKGGQDVANVSVPLPPGCTLPNRISEDDFLERPKGFFKAGKETVFMQILNLDARANTEIGPVRIILGETLKREQPDLFKPSLGMAQSLGQSGFPASLFFNPVALVETPFGSFRAIHGTLAYGRITSFPPIGTPVSIQAPVPMEPMDALRSAMAAGQTSVQPLARIISLAHPIDVGLQIPGDEAFRIVEGAIASAGGAAVGLSGTTFTGGPTTPGSNPTPPAGGGRGR